MKVASGQHVMIAEQEQVPDELPASTAEKRLKLAVDPETLFKAFVSDDARHKREMLTKVGMAWVPEDGLTDVRLFAVNLDSEPSLERVLVFRGSGWVDGVAVIAKQENGVWWDIGEFYSGGPGSPHNEPFIELKETVRSGTKDLIVHSGGPQGTGVGARNLAIYRVWKGHLYRVLQIVESAYNLAGEEASRVVSTEMCKRVSIHN